MANLHINILCDMLIRTQRESFGLFIKLSPVVNIWQTAAYGTENNSLFMLNILWSCDCAYRVMCQTECRYVCMYVWELLTMAGI